MARDQTPRRRKRRNLGSAYAGDVKPPGILRLFTSRRVIVFTFVFLALAMGASVGTGALRLRSSSNPHNRDVPFVNQGDDKKTPDATPEITQYEAAPALTIAADKSYTALVKTDVGEFEIELFADQAPNAVNSFVFLARDGFYDGLTFHRAEDFVVQGGDPTGTGTGGPGYDLATEDSGAFDAGSVGLGSIAGEPDTVNGSQFFIALTGEGDFADSTLFGRVVSGMDVAGQITVGTHIESITIQEAPATASN